MCNTHLQIIKYIIPFIVNLIFQSAFTDFCKTLVSVVSLWLQFNHDLPNGVEPQYANSFPNTFIVVISNV